MAAPAVQPSNNSMQSQPASGIANDGTGKLLTRSNPKQLALANNWKVSSPWIHGLDPSKVPSKNVFPKPNNGYKL
jgi:hypothetical protein